RSARTSWVFPRSGCKGSRACFPSDDERSGLKREVPLLLTFLFGLFFVLSNFIVADRWKLAAESVNNWVLIVIAFTYVLGVGNILRIHGLKISRQETGWGYSLATILGLLVMLLF